MLHGLNPPLDSSSINAASLGRISCSNTVSELSDQNPVRMSLDLTVPCQATSEVYSL